MWNSSVKSDYLEGLITDAIENYSIRGNEDSFTAIIVEMKKYFKNCTQEELMDILALCISMYNQGRKESTELVLTSPDSFRVRARKTNEVFYSLLRNAEKSIVITGYSISDYVNEMIDLIIKKSQQGIYVVLYIDDVEKHKLIFQRILSYQSKFLKVYEYQKNKDDRMAALHAKILVVDKKISLISSANLSYHGMSGNIEMGLLLSSEEKAKKIEEILKEFIRMKVVALYK